MRPNGWFEIQSPVFTGAVVVATDSGDAVAREKQGNAVVYTLAEETDLLRNGVVFRVNGQTTYSDSVSHIYLRTKQDYVATLEYSSPTLLPTLLLLAAALVAAFAAGSMTMFLTIVCLAVPMLRMLLYKNVSGSMYYATPEGQQPERGFTLSMGIVQRPMLARLLGGLTGMIPENVRYVWKLQSAYATTPEGQAQVSYTYHLPAAAFPPAPAPSEEADQA